MAHPAGEGDLSGRLIRLEQLLAAAAPPRPPAADGGDAAPAHPRALELRRLQALAAFATERRGTGPWDEGDALLARLLIEDLRTAAAELSAAADRVRHRLEATGAALAGARSLLS